MPKCILFVRVSTNRQETESQLKETQEFAESLGYDEFVPIEREGASAYAVSKLYVEMVEEMKTDILTDKEIKAVVCWHLNRLCRNDIVAMQIKDFLIKNHVQLHIKEPNMTLLNPDGTVNSGMELAFSLFATMSQQQTKELKEKSKRAKRRDAAVQKFLGGKIRFGYSVIDKKVVPHEEEANIIREIYNMYSTGKWSYSSLLQEINQRYGLDFKRDNFFKIMQTTKYYDGKNYPPIISKETWLKCEEVRKQSTTNRPSNYKRLTFANRILKCPICGKGYTANQKVYSCVIHGGQHVSIKHLDGLLWTIAANLESDYLVKKDDNTEIIEKIGVLRTKVETGEKEKEKNEKKKDKINDLYIDGSLTKEQHSEKMQQISGRIVRIENDINEWKLEIKEYEKMLSEEKNAYKKILDIADRISKKTENEMREIVRKWVKTVTFNGEIFTINTISRTYKCRYKRYNDIKWWTLVGNPLIIRPIERNNSECRLMEPHKKLNANHLVPHLVWLSGSQIV